MVKSFAMPPLVETIAELRWIPGGVKVAQDDPNALEIQSSTFFDSRHDELYMRFAQQVAVHGYTQIERLVPAGIPSLLFTPTYRYKEAAGASTTLYHLGLGIFSAHTIPPYQSWEAFKPVVQRGIAALQQAHGNAAPPAFNSVLLRYIDNFTEIYTQGRSLDAFLKVLGIDIRLPDAITKHLAVNKEVTPRLQVVMPLNSGMHLQLSISDGKSGNQAGIVMDTIVSATTPITANVNDVMAALEQAHTVIHDTFVDMTVQLHQVMKPAKG